MSTNEPTPTVASETRKCVATTLRSNLDEAARMLVFAMRIYPNYRLDSRGPRGCIADVLAIIAPDVLAEVEASDWSTVYGRRWQEPDDEPDPSAPVWHLTNYDVLGSAHCGADYPNIRSTERRANVTCVECLKPDEPSAPVAGGVSDPTFLAWWNGEHDNAYTNPHMTISRENAAYLAWRARSIRSDAEIATLKADKATLCEREGRYAKRISDGELLISCCMDALGPAFGESSDRPNRAEQMPGVIIEIRAELAARDRTLRAVEQVAEEMRRSFKGARPGAERILKHFADRVLALCKDGTKVNA